MWYGQDEIFLNCISTTVILLDIAFLYKPVTLFISSIKKKKIQGFERTSE